MHVYFIVLSQFDDLFFISDCLAFDNVLYACLFVDSFIFVPICHMNVLCLLVTGVDCFIGFLLCNILGAH